MSTCLREVEYSELKLTKCDECERDECVIHLKDGLLGTLISQITING